MRKPKRQPLAAATTAKTETHHPRAESVRRLAVEEPQKQVHAYIPASLHTRFKIKAAEDGRKMSDVLQAMITDYVGL